MSLKLDCKQVSRLFSDGADRELAAGDRARLRLHLVLCDACRNVEEQMAFLRQAMRTLGREDEPPPGA
jgi:predicted anti-sigma-YlaC factor YlaD